MEVRDPEIRRRKIKVIFPRLLFHKCCVCKFEFRNTTMWAWIDTWDYEDGPNWKCACTSCVSEYKDVFPLISDFKPAQL